MRRGFAGVPEHPARDLQFWRGGVIMLTPLPRAGSIVLALLLATACAGSEVVAEPVIPGPPTMVEVSPGVWIAEDYDYPLYYSDGFYWSLRGDVWYRSPAWDHGYVRYPREQVPQHIVNQPHDQYRHYHASADAERVYVPQGERPHSNREAHEHEHEPHEHGEHMSHGGHGHH
jgi:hypothetical protein